MPVAPDMIAWGLGKLSDWQKQFHGVSATYRRGVTEWDLAVTLGKAIQLSPSPIQEVIVNNLERDFIFTAADILVESEPLVPEEGDELDVEINGEAVTYTVIRFGPNAPCWTWEDDHRVRRRVHTKEL